MRQTCQYLQVFVYCLLTASGAAEPVTQDCDTLRIDPRHIYKYLWPLCTRFILCHGAGDLMPPFPSIIEILFVHSLIFLLVPIDDRLAMAETSGIWFQLEGGVTASRPTGILH